MPGWPDPRHPFSTPSPAFCCLWCPHILQGLLKEKLELEKVKKKDGRTRVTLKPIEDQLTFDKVNRRNTIVISTPGTIRAFDVSCIGGALSVHTAGWAAGGFMAAARLQLLQPLAATSPISSSISGHTPCCHHRPPPPPPPPPRPSPRWVAPPSWLDRAAPSSSK